MEKKIAGLLGAMATLGAFNAAQAAPTPSPAPTDVLRANSFADLLEPIPNAAALLQAVDESRPAPSADENVQLAQYYHHHHHHGYYRRYGYEGYGNEGYGPRVIVVPRYRRYYDHHHHHHHHHHHSFYRRDY
jgi:guanyl-specific ribonuclease Sa